MLGHMKTQTTNASTETISVTVPKAIAPQVYDAIASLLKLANIHQINDDGEKLYSMSDIFPDGSPAMALRGLRKKENITQKQLAEKLGIAQTRVSEMENGKYPISKAMAKRIEAAFNMPYKLFL